MLAMAAGEDDEKNARRVRSVKPLSAQQIISVVAEN